MKVLMLTVILMGHLCYASYVKDTYYLTRSIDDAAQDCIPVSDDLSKCPSNDLNEARQGEPIDHYLDREILKELHAADLVKGCEVHSDNIAYCPLK